MEEESSRMTQVSGSWWCEALRECPRSGRTGCQCRKGPASTLRLPGSQHWLCAPGDMPRLVLHLILKRRIYQLQDMASSCSPIPALTFLAAGILSQAHGPLGNLLPGGSHCREHELLGDSKGQAGKPDRTELGKHKAAKRYTFRCAKSQTSVFYYSPHLAVELENPQMTGRGVWESLWLTS